MQLSTSKTKKFLIFPEINLSGLIFSLYFFIFWEMELSSSKIENFLIFSQKETFLIFREIETLKNFLYFRK